MRGRFTKWGKASVAVTRGKVTHILHFNTASLLLGQNAGDTPITTPTY